MHVLLTSSPCSCLIPEIDARPLFFSFPRISIVEAQGGRQTGASPFFIVSPVSFRHVVRVLGPRTRTRPDQTRLHPSPLPLVRPLVRDERVHGAETDRTASLLLQSLQADSKVRRIASPGTFHDKGPSGSRPQQPATASNRQQTCWAERLSAAEAAGAAPPSDDATVEMRWSVRAERQRARAAGPHTLVPPHQSTSVPLAVEPGLSPPSQVSFPKTPPLCPFSPKGPNPEPWKLSTGVGSQLLIVSGQN